MPTDDPILDLNRADTVMFQDHRELIDATPILDTRPDPDWYYVDAKGHRHYWLQTGGRWKLPTLREVVKTGWSDDTHDIYSYVDHHACTRCGEPVLPGTLLASERQTVLGMQRRSLTITWRPTEMEVEPLIRAFHENRHVRVIFPIQGKASDHQGYITSITDLNHVEWRMDVQLLRPWIG